MPFDLLFWEPEISPHKLPLYRALRDHAEVRSATFIYEAPLNAQRLAQGWADGALDEDQLVQAGDAAAVERLITEAPVDAIHIFSGMHWVPSITTGLALCIKHGRRFGLLHEPRVLAGLAGKARLAHSWLTERPLRRHAQFILAVGRHGPAWFRLAGFRAERIFPFAYFLPKPGALGKPKGERLCVGFVGRLSRAKGFHLFLDALDDLPLEAEIHIAGSGALAEAGRQRLATRAGGTFHGALPMASVAALMDRLDILVLPSTTTDDGWGAVISEALLAGAAVVCSDRVGASMCVLSPDFGSVFSNLSGRAIAAAVMDIASSDALRQEKRRLRQRWATEHLSQRAGADYLLAILRHRFGGAARPPSFIDGTGFPA